MCSKTRLKSAKSPLPVDVRRSKTSLLKLPISKQQWRIQGGAWGGPVPPPYFQTKLRPEGPEKIFKPALPLTSGSGWPPPLIWRCGSASEQHKATFHLKCSAIKSNFHILTTNGWAKNKNNKVKKRDNFHNLTMNQLYYLVLKVSWKEIKCEKLKRQTAFLPWARENVQMRFCHKC